MMPLNPSLEPTQKPPAQSNVAFWQQQSKNLEQTAVGLKRALYATPLVLAVLAAVQVPWFVLGALAAVNFGTIGVGGYMVSVRRHECQQKKEEALRAAQSSPGT